MVGIVNTLVDVSLFTFLHIHHVALVLANICSTTVGLLISLLLNYRFTFRTKPSNIKIILYFVVTVFGLWVIQPIFISLVMAAIHHIRIIQTLLNPLGHTNIVNNVIPKLVSLIVTLIWNYSWYSRYIFKGSPKTDLIEKVVEDL